MKTLMAIAGAALLSASALAGGEACRNAANASACANSQASCQGNAMDTGAAEARAAKFQALGVPIMTFEVGDKTTHCPLEARALVKETGAKPVFHFQDKTYTDGDEAMNAWAGALKMRLDELTQVSFVVNGAETDCPVQAAQMAESAHCAVQTRLASQTFSCENSAKAAALRAVQAADAVPFVMTVGDTEYHCPLTAAEASRLTGEPVVYTVNGVSIECQKTATCLLLLNRILATADAIEHAAA